MKRRSTLDRQLPRIRGPFDRERVSLRCRDHSRTHQSFKAECDINTIMRKYERGALIEHVNRHQGDYGDFSDAPTDYASALNQVLAAQAMFLTLPAKVRDRFGNDPGTFLDFTSDPANAEEMVSLGLADPLSRPPSAKPTAGGGEGVDEAPEKKSDKAPPAPGSTVST